MLANFAACNPDELQTVERSFSLLWFFFFFHETSEVQAQERFSIAE